MSGLKRANVTFQKCACLGLQLLPPIPPTESITPMAETQLHGNRESTSEDTLHTTVNLEALQQVKSAESPAILLHNPNRLKITLILQRCCPISFFLIMAFKLHCVRLYFFFFFFIFLPFNKCDNSGQIITHRLYIYGRLGSRSSYK